MLARLSHYQCLPIHKVKCGNCITVTGITPDTGQSAIISFQLFRERLFLEKEEREEKRDGPSNSFG